MKKIIIASIICACACIQLKAQLANAADIDKALQQKQSELGANSITLVYKNGKVEYKKVVGEEMNEKAEVKLGSASQWLVATLALQFVDEGKLNLDSKVADYLPDFGKYGKKYITIRHCLTHLTGIEGKKGSAAYLENPKFESLEALVNQYPKNEIRANAGTDFYFGNIGPNIIARIIEIIAKKDFEQLIAAKLLKPLGMKATNFSNQNGGCAIPANGATSTPNDYMNFLSMLLNKGMFNGKRILSEASIEQMLQPQMLQTMVKNTTHFTQGLDFGIGVWLQEKDANGKTTVVSSCNQINYWSCIDFCKGYAYVTFCKKNVGDAGVKPFTKIKNIIDEGITTACQ